MNDLLTKAYNWAEQYKGGKLINLLIVIFILFLVLGLSVGAIINKVSDTNISKSGDSGKILEETPLYYEGVITYIDPSFNPLSNISFVLTDSKGKDIILLSAKDQKLVVSEGHFAKVYGKLSKTADKTEDLLLVEKVVIKNDSN